MRTVLMALKILSSEGGVGPAVFYDSVTMVAFGPVMTDATWAEEFAEWLRSRGVEAADLRGEAPRLVDLWGQFESGYTLCDECGMTATPKGHPTCSLCRGGMTSSASRAAMRILATRKLR